MFVSRKDWRVDSATYYRSIPLALIMPISRNEGEDIHDLQQQAMKDTYHNSNNLFSATHDIAQVSHTAASTVSLATAAAAAACGVTHSVVPDLMRVYENMTQVSKPTHLQGSQYSNNPSEYGQQSRQPHYHDQHDAPSMYYQHPQHHQAWTYESSSIAIPPPYPLPQQEPPPDTRANIRGAQHGTDNTSGRLLRKRHATEEPAGYASSTGSSSRGRPKSRRKGGSNKISSGSDKKSKNDKSNDGRWSKRFTWPEDLHRDFVSAIFDVGLKHSSPSTVMEQMPPHEQISTERIKSHLQKYRLHRQKSKKEFMSCYEATVQKLNADGLSSITVLAGGEIAGHLTYATLTQPDPELDQSCNSDNAAEEASTQEAAKKQERQAKPEEQQQPQDVFVLPRLTEAEKQSPIGSSLGYLLGLFFSLKQQLDDQRQLHRQKEVVAAEAATAQKRMLEQEQLQLYQQQQQRQQEEHLTATAVFDSFVSERIVEPPQPSRHDVVIPIASAAAIPMNVPSTTRSNLEENSMMKREMQSQMAFQNKMRALKLQELNKHKMTGGKTITNVDHQMQQEKIASVAINPDQGVQADVQQQDHQIAGELGGADRVGRNRNPSLSLGDEEDFWNTAVVDDELFDFLMNN